MSLTHDEENAHPQDQVQPEGREPARTDDTIVEDNPDLPTATSPVACAFHNIPLPDQISSTATAYTFLTSQRPDLSRLNSDSTPLFCALVHLPRSTQVRVVYGLGIGTPGLIPNPLDKVPLCLTGDVDEDRPLPSGLKLHTSFFKPTSIFVPTADLLAPHIDDDSITWPALKATTHDANRATFTKPVVRICPVPAFVVYDGFDMDLHITVVLRRLANMDNQDAPWCKNAIAFIRSCFVLPKANTAGSALATEFFASRPSKELHQWSKRRFLDLFPNLRSSPSPPATAPSPAQPDLAAIYAQLLALQQAHQPAQTTPAEEKKDDAHTSLSMAPSELTRLLKMCGLSEGQEEFLPPLWQKLAESGLGKEGKNLAIREAVQAASSSKYPEAPVPLLSPLLSTIRSREWSGDSGHPTLVGAVKGLSPFLMTEVSAEEEATYNELHDIMEKATLHTFDDIKKSTKIEAKVPSSFNDLLSTLKAFCTLLLALFGRMCPFLIALDDIVRELALMNPYGRATLLKKHRAAIMWVVFLQAREFARGTMAAEDADSHLPAFFHLRLDIKAGREVSNTSVPLHLLADPPAPKSKQKRSQDEDTAEDAQKPSKRTPVLVPRHAKLTTALGPLFAAHPRVSIKQLCEASGASIKQLFPNNPKRCLLAALKGKCTYSQCRNDHSFVVTDSEADHVCRILEPIIQDPSKLSNVS